MRKQAQAKVIPSIKPVMEDDGHLSEDQAKVKAVIEDMEAMGKKKVREVSDVEAKMKAAVAAGLVPISLSRVEELLLRSEYLQAKLLESQYLTARSEYTAQFDRRSDVMEVLRRIQLAQADFAKTLEEAYTAHGTDAAHYMYDMDMRALVPRPNEKGDSNGEAKETTT
ncbi:hypothetical protein LCGC14_1913920 [marine sediment metagenome]|uniref:Uncharacterized protein n=1 Tax=marine sediment metagenome TaxID=412755 RepID=A0A0F9FTE8_9ZZZZ